MSKISPSAIISNDQVIKGQQALTHKGSLAERFEGARQVFTLQLMENIFSFDGIDQSFNYFLYSVKKYSDKLNAEGIDQCLDLHQDFIGDKATGMKFIAHIQVLMKEEAVIEKNSRLQQRIMDAANHFDKKLNILLDKLKHSKLVTEHREAANEINENLLELILSVHSAWYAVQYCKNSFQVQGFLKHKIEYGVPRIAANIYASAKKQTAQDIPNAELFETLKRWRDMACEESGLAIYMVANAQTLKDLSVYLPLTKKDLMRIRGFGKAKVDKYGDDILSAIDSYCSQYNLATNMDALPSKISPVKQAKTPGKVDSKAITLELFRQGLSISQIATERKLVDSTIESHLSHFISTGNIALNEILTDDIINTIQIAMSNGFESLQELKSNLPDHITYGNIRMVLALKTDKITN